MQSASAADGLNAGAGGTVDSQPGHDRAPSGGFLGYLRDIFLAPFRQSPDRFGSVPVSELERRRRAALLRLVLVCLITLAALVLLPAALLGHAETASLLRLGFVLALAVGCAVLNRLGHTMVAGLLFVFGTLGITLHFLVTNPVGLDQPAVLTFALMSVLILMVGLILPGWLTWLTAGVMAVVTLAGVLLMPIAPTLAGASSDRLSLRFAIAGPLLTLDLFVAVFSWVAARSASAGLDAAARAFARERELVALKDQFIIYANHELRTPIMALSANVQLLEKLGDRAGEEYRVRVLARASQASRAVQQLLHSVLDAGALESGLPPLAIEPVTLLPLIRDVAETFDPQEIGESGLEGVGEQSRALTLQIPADLKVQADPGRLRQILLNLLTNALKYSAQGTAIAIHAAPLDAQTRARTGHRRSGIGARQVCISVQDQGLGVPPQDAHKLFNRFVRLERDISGPIRGTGVGLYLCRQLVEAMGGRIWVESTGVEGQGSAFRFTLPLAAS
jgi:signal transduction histidine kinase